MCAGRTQYRIPPFFNWTRFMKHMKNFMGLKLDELCMLEQGGELY